MDEKRGHLQLMYFCPDSKSNKEHERKGEKTGFLATVNCYNRRCAVGLSRLSLMTGLKDAFADNRVKVLLPVSCDRDVRS